MVLLIFLYWFEHADDNHTALKCWTKEDRKVGVR